MATKTIKNPDGTYTTYDDQSYTPPVSAPSAITPDSLSNTETPATLPQQPGEPDYTGSMASIPSLDSLTTTGTKTATETKQDDLASRLEQAYAKLSGKAPAQAAAEQAAGLPAFQTQLTDISGQIQALQKEALAIPLQIQQDATGRGVTAGGVAPIQASRLRENAIKSLSLSAIAQTLQGNIALAQQQATKAVDAEFAPAQAQLEYLGKALQLNSEALSREDKKKADQLQIKLQERQRLLDQQKEDRHIIIGWAAEASKNGASSYLINQALQQNDPREALGILAGHFQDPNAKAQALADLDYRRAQIKAVNADTNLTYAQTEKVLAEKAKAIAETVLANNPNIQNSEVLDNYSLATAILNDPNLSVATGLSSILAPGNYLPGASVQYTKNQIKQLKALLALDNRQKLKGSGAVSDYESRILNQSASSLGTNLSDKDFVRELKKVRGVFATAAGLQTTVQITDPRTGKSKTGVLDRAGVESAIASGFSVEYK